MVIETLNPFPGEDKDDGGSGSSIQQPQDQARSISTHQSAIVKCVGNFLQRCRRGCKALRRCLTCCRKIKVHPLSPIVTESPLGDRSFSSDTSSWSISIDGSWSSESLGEGSINSETGENMSMICETPGSETGTSLESQTSIDQTHESETPTCQTPELELSIDESLKRELTMRGTPDSDTVTDGYPESKISTDESLEWETTI